MPETILANPIQATGAVDPVWYASGDPWILQQDKWDPERSQYFETIFSLSNGYMGFRGYREEQDNVFASFREGYLAGVFAKLPPIARKLVVHNYPWDSRQMVSLPQIFSALITLDGEAFSLLDGTLLSYRQTLDLRQGLLTRAIHWQSSSGRETILQFKRFLSAEIPHLAAHKIEIEPINWSGPVEVWWDYDLSEKTVFRCGDPAKAHVPCADFEVKTVFADESSVGGVVRTMGTGHEIALVTYAQGGEVSSSAEGSGILSQLASESVIAGQSLSFSRMTAICTSRDPGNDKREHLAMQIAQKAAERGFDDLLGAHEAIWNERWKSADIEIEGNPHDQVLVRFGVFSLLQVAPYHSNNLSIPARCYAWNRYNGLYFWDGEIFLLPFYQFCAPEVARNLLEFRCRTLDGAKVNAAKRGAPGALFPWQGDADFGEEQAPWGLEEYLWHQNADIIFAFDQYVRSTGDEDFMLHKGLEVLAETARFWASCFELGADGLYHLENTVGPDEAEEHGPDNGYTSLMARRSLEISCHWWTRAVQTEPAFAKEQAQSLNLSEKEIVQWKSVAEKVHIPQVPGEPGVPLQDAYLLQRRREDISNMTVAEFWEQRGEVQVIKQADIVLAMYLLEDQFSQDEIKRGYEFYEPRTLHVSSLSLNTHCIVAAITGKKEEAYDYFRKAAGLDLDNLRNATKDGLHAAALGAVWQMTIPGFMGLRVREDHLYLQPAPPANWSKVSFPLSYRGWELHCSIGSGSYRIVVSGEGEDGARLVIGETVHVLAKASELSGKY
jgi:hypothetical glycosyl hydrolase